MRFADIPAFPRGDYEVNVDWTYVESKLAREDPKIDLEPDFQRAHVWTREQQIAYVEYRLHGGESGSLLYFNCPGWMGDFRGPYQIVDGKQRLESVRAFMRSELPVFGHYYNEFTDHIRSRYATFHWRVAALESRANILRWYLAINKGGTPHASEELARVEELLRQEQRKK